MDLISSNYKTDEYFQQLLHNGYESISNTCAVPVGGNEEGLCLDHKFQRFISNE